MAGTIPKVFISEQYAPTSTASALYTAVNCTATITTATACNNHTANVICNVYLVPNGGSVGNSTRVVYDRQIAPKETYGFYEELRGKALAAGGAIYISSDVANVLTIGINGNETTT